MTSSSLGIVVDVNVDRHFNDLLEQLKILNLNGTLMVFVCLC